MNIGKIRKSYNRHHVQVIDWPYNVMIHFKLALLTAFFKSSIFYITGSDFSSIWLSYSKGTRLQANMHALQQHRSKNSVFIPPSLLPLLPSHLTFSLQVRPGVPGQKEPHPNTDSLSIYIYTGNRVNGWSLYLLWKAIMLCLSQELESCSQMSRAAMWDRKYGWDSAILLSVSSSSSFISIRFFFPNL